MAAQSFVDLRVWKEAHGVASAVYRTTSSFPLDEKYGLALQMRRAAASIAANIAEGFGRRRAADKTRFYNISQASAEELKYYFILCRGLGLTRNMKKQYANLESVSRRLRNLVRSIPPNA